MVRNILVLRRIWTPEEVAFVAMGQPSGATTKAEPLALSRGSRSRYLVTCRLLPYPCLWVPNFMILGS